MSETATDRKLMTGEEVKAARDLWEFITICREIRSEAEKLLKPGTEHVARANG